MKKFLSALLIALSANTYAAVDVHNTNLQFVNQFDNESTSFVFSTGSINGCGSVYYKVKSSNDDIANRKFAITMKAFEMDSSFSFHDTEVCEGDQSIVKWVRIVK